MNLIYKIKFVLLGTLFLIHTARADGGALQALIKCQQGLDNVQYELDNTVQDLENVMQIGEGFFAQGIEIQINRTPYRLLYQQYQEKKLRLEQEKTALQEEMHNIMSNIRTASFWV